jgi:MFS family permease
LHPRSWPKWKKLANIGVIAIMSRMSHMIPVNLSLADAAIVLSPLASSMFAPGIDEIAEDLKVKRNSVIGCQTGFVIALGIGPLLLAPLSETFGRRIVYFVCFSIFTLLQIPTAMSKSLPVLIALRTFTGFFGSKNIRLYVRHVLTHSRRLSRQWRRND